MQFANRRLPQQIGLFLGVALSSLTLLIAVAAATEVTFRYQPVIGGVDNVSVAGSFNGWDAGANPMSDDDEDGIWELVLDLEPGRYEYKFVVNGEQWFEDEFAAEFSPDGFGGQNSVLEVKDEAVIAGVGTTIKRKEAPKLGLRQVTFRYEPPGTPRELSLAGSFNDWTPSQTLMTDPDGDGEFTTTLLLPVGEYQYKFVVNGNQWVQDTTGEDSNTDDGFGGKNSVIVVDNRFPEVQVARGDGEIFTEGITHEQSASEVNAMGDGVVEFTVPTHHGDVEKVSLHMNRDGNETVLDMEPVNRDKIFDYYRAKAEPGALASYYFSYHDGGTTLYLTRAGLTASADPAFSFEAADFPVFTTPDWVKNGVFYQIFPERFRNGSETNDQTFEEWYYEGKTTLPASGKTNGEYYHNVEDWYDVSGLTTSPYRTDGRPDYFSFYGGDVKGLHEGLDYLEELGITVIYFNPLFEAKSNHKYDCCDYLKIDPHFGTNEEFIDFVKDAHARGIRIVLDIVYNHCGSCHWAFRDAVENGEDSQYFDWFEFKRWPLPGGWPNVPREWNASDYYYCWWGFGDLPDLNFDLSRNNDQEKTIRDASRAQVNMALVTYLLDATEFWVKDVGVDGFRLDVPNELPPWFWTAFRKRVKEANPDAYLVGELWGNAKADVGPHMFDAVMNYAFFRDPVTQFLGHGRGSAAEFDATLAAGRIQYPTQAVQAQMNLIDSHDTVRFLTQVGGDHDRLKLAVLFGMTYVGAPHIYYGDEIGMEGGKDPDCRRPFLWNYTEDPARVALLDYYKKLIQLRKDHAALRTGEFESVLVDNKLYGYVRGDGNDEFLVLLNAGRSDATVNLDLARWGGKLEATDEMSGEKSDWSGTAHLTLPGGSGRIFRIARPAS